MRASIRRPTLPRRRRGVAVITALLLTTLAISIVASLFWQQQVQVRSMENQRLHLQTRWILRGALDWSTLLLFQDGLDNPRFTALTQVWATPLAETRLDQYIERERIEGENFNATLSGNVTDACSRYNLRNLAVDRGNRDGDQSEVFSRLLSNLQLDPALAKQVASLVAASMPVQTVADTANNGQTQTGTTQPTTQTTQTTQTSGTNAVSGVTGSPMPFLAVDDLLSIPGFTPAMVERLRPFVIVLPNRTAVNVNTAAPEVLAAVANVSMSAANTMLVRRKQAPWDDKAKFVTELASQSEGAKNISGMVDVRSEYFLVDTHIRLDRAALDAEALVYRPLILLSTGPTVLWVRQY
jgi:general secretion pathway protein K